MREKNRVVSKGMLLQQLLLLLSHVSHVRLCDPMDYAAAAAAKSLQSCPTLCDPIDGSPPGSLVPGILQARILEWVSISFSRGSSRPWDRN